MAGSSLGSSLGTSPDGPRGRTGGPPRRDRRRPPPRRLDESMTLLREVMEQPLDPGYATAAARRATGRPRVRRRTTTVTLAAVAVVLGLLVTWAVVVLRQPEPSTLRARDVLVRQIVARTQENEETIARIERYRGEVRAAQEQVLGRTGDPAAAARAVALQVASGDVTVTGPGVKVELDDAPGSRDDGGANADPRADESAENGRVFDRDLQVVVNGLWAAGAEAVSVNDQRLTSLSAIRSAGEAILVDFRPLVPPYTVLAIGDPNTLQAGFAAGAAGPYVQSLEENFGVSVSIDAEAEVVVEGSRSLVLRAAVPVGAAGLPSPPATAPAGAALPSASSTAPASSPEATP